MIKNVGNFDRILRFVFSGLVLVMVLSGKITGLVALVLIIVSIVLVITGLIGWCGLYKLLGISTVKKNK